ncbi:hypothetical protein BDV96DRAFT_608721 [Lophiotrema nucula]|uniref:Nucleotide-diphospho-sugar transferase n=1 Tax=Lophiotrema nucula TaxID=690887 RepID=A0A6A5ZVA9_9PLEO|nr:hypothetical protein BDV96DRAFT_608721 [Lophiotrema nucula]
MSEILEEPEASYCYPIPSIVHYVLLKKDEDSIIEFHFAHFLAIYASVVYIEPERISIHTDFNSSEIENALKNGSKWTRKDLSTFPKLLTLNSIQVPQWAGANELHKIDAIEHKSDFVRWNEIVKVGGIYMDWDVVALRPISAILNCGFAFVAGRQYGNEHEDGKVNGTVNNGVFLTKPNSAMARITVREQPIGFQGDWEGNQRFRTQVAERLVAVSNQVLILDRHAFAPTHWFVESIEALFLPNEGPPSPEPVNIISNDPVELYDNIIRNRMNRMDWEMDLSATYLLHAFSQQRHNHDITPKKILSRTSNYGIATWEVVRRMKVEGHVSGDEDEG